MIVLGIETSCDETSVSIVEKNRNSLGGKVLSESTLSQINKHKVFGGVVPELASREHSNVLHSLVKHTLKKSKLNLCKIDGFAATTGPGLLGGLLVGSNYAKGLALSQNKPFIPVNHLQGHILVSRMKENVIFPFLCLLASGGHTQILIADNFNKFKLLGETIDDALGEAFDKTAKVLGYSYPGGPIIEKLALRAKKKSFSLPRPLIKEKNCNFSFSGLKTSVRRIVEKGISQSSKKELAHEFQNSVVDCLIVKTERALKIFKKKYNQNGSLVFSGGVASNKFIKSKIAKLCFNLGVKFFVPDSKLCVDNATMIAWTGIEKLCNGEKNHSLKITPKPRWDLSNL